MDFKYKSKAVRLLSSAAMCLGMIAVVSADDDFAKPGVSYTKDVAPIMVNHCVSCHRPGESAPMTLMSYEETRPWAKSIKNSVTSREMPPWDANPAHGKFINDISLSDAQIATIVNWVDSGAPMGDMKDMPKMPEYQTGWQLGEPDYIIELPEVDIPAEGDDLFPNLNVTIDIPEKRWIRAVEVRPGDREVLHHIVLFTSGVGMSSAAGTFDALAVWAVGTGPVVYPEGMGRWVQPKMRITSNMHYHPSGKATKDKSQVALYFGEGDLTKQISSALGGTININIPPQTKDYKMEATYYVNQDIQAISYFPHMHMRGQTMKFTAKYPDGSAETLIDVPKYDFNWQWFYYLQEPKLLPADTEIFIEAWYDNTSGNPNNPNPDDVITFGEQSTDEMMFGFFEFIPVEGVAPKPISADRLFKKIAAKMPQDEVYELSAGMGMMGLKSLMHLPKDGKDGTLFFSFGGSVMPIELKGVKWDGDNFTFDMSFMGGRFGSMTATGSVDAEGKLSGEFKPSADMEKRMADLEASSGVPSAEENEDEDSDEKGEGRRGRGGRGMFMSNFTGKRMS